jgi:hypothetical protein
MSKKKKKKRQPWYMHEIYCTCNECEYMRRVAGIPSAIKGASSRLPDTGD